MSAAALSYYEPEIITILTLSSFLLLLNIINYVLDRIVYCGLIGQILVGVAWGTPGLDWLSLQVQNTVMQLGYLGLIFIVYEGGLSTDLKTLRADFFLSATVAGIGIGCPIGLSFILRYLLEVSPLQAFAAGAALCSTSLGTTFTVLSTSGLTESRLDVVLSSAAMMDDVVGLVMVRIISELGQTSSFDLTTVIRPIMVAIAFAVVVPLLCVWVVKPLTKWTHSMTSNEKSKAKHYPIKSKETMFAMHTALLIAMVAGSSCAGTSNLFAAYLAGAAVAWWSDLCMGLSEGHHGCTAPETGSDTEVRGKEQTVERNTLTSQQSSSPRPVGRTGDTGLVGQPPEENNTKPKVTVSGPTIYEHYYGQAVRTTLKPFFFASIGFSIPITNMFSGAIIWRGLIYSTLMAFGKLLCGICLVRFTGPSISTTPLRRLLPINIRSCWPSSKSRVKAEAQTPGLSQPIVNEQLSANARPSAGEATKTSTSPKPRSLYPAAVLGSAMVARGEIGFLISSVAESKGIFGSKSEDGSSELFRVVTWAILVCTVFGPVVVGLLVKHVRRLQETERRKRSGREDPLGIWGVISTG